MARAVADRQSAPPSLSRWLFVSRLLARGRKSTASQITVAPSPAPSSEDSRWIALWYHKVERNPPGHTAIFTRTKIPDPPCHAECPLHTMGHEESIISVQPSRWVAPHVLEYTQKTDARTDQCPSSAGMVVAERRGRMQSTRGEYGAIAGVLATVDQSKTPCHRARARFKLYRKVHNSKIF